MTAIAGLVDDDGRVWIGGDSLGTAGRAQRVRGDAKVFTNGAYVFGFTDSYRMGQVLRHGFKPPPPPARPKDVYRFLVTEFIDAVRETLTDAGYARTSDNVETGGTFLIGVAGALYCVESDYQVGIPACGYEAIGAGDQIVMGSLHATAGRGFHPRYRVRLALDAAATFSGGVAPPFVIKSVGA